MPKLTTPIEAGRILGGSKPIPTTTLAYWRKNGTGPEYVRVGRQYRYPEDALHRFIDQHTKK